MTRFVHRLAAGIAVASVSLTGVAVATAAVSSATCDPNWSRNVWTNECHPAPAPPAWYTPNPDYAPSFAQPWIPPPPPPPPWAQDLHPIWDVGHAQWVWVRI
jgi:hypothetical protein